MGYLEDDAGFNLQEPQRKQILRVQVPYVLRFALIWTLFFSIIGIVIQSIQATSFVFVDFFAKNYIDWFKSFGTFTEQTVYSSVEEVFFAILGKWYYFFITGGLISLIWGLISWIINFEIVFTKRKQIQRQEVIPPQIQKQTQIETQVEEPVRTFEFKNQDENLEKVNEWLSEGLLLLAEGNLEEAELIYENLRREYNPDNDAYGVLQRRILSFYEEIMAEKKERMTK